MKKVFVISSIMAFLVASLSAFSVFAAPSTLSRAWGSQLTELQADRNFYTHVKADHQNFVKPADPAKLQQDLNRFAIALTKAQAIVNNRANTEVLNAKGMTTAAVNRQDQAHQTAEQQLAALLHEMRDLKAAINLDI